MGGRAARHRMREEGPVGERRPIRASMPSGNYRPLAESDLARIHVASLDILERIGIADATPAWRDRVVAAGGSVSAAGRLCFPRALVEDAIAGAGRNITLPGRDPRHDLDLSGDRVNTGGGSATIEILDPETGRYRPTTLVDLYDTVRFEDTLDNLHFIIRSCIARDMVEARDLDLNTAYACLSATTKHMVTSFFQPEHLEEAAAMFDISLGGDGGGDRFRARPFVTPICTFVVPPLRFAPDACRVLDTAVGLGMSVLLTTGGQAGATAPASLAGSLAQSNAELLGGITALHLLAPGHPVIYANHTMVCDLRSGAFAGGSGEMALLAACAAQLGGHYDLPTSVLAGISSSKLPDAQSGWEKGYLTTLPALAGANMILQTSGILADIIASSLESFAIDADMLGGVLRGVRGVEVDDDTLSVGVMEEVVAGPGHYLGHEQTIRLMESEYVYPTLGDRRTIQDWEEDGAQDIRARARAALSRVLSTHYPQYVEPADDARIRERFAIGLAPEDMRPGNGRW